MTMKSKSAVRLLLVLSLVLALAAGSVLASEHPLLEEAKQEGKAVFYANITGVESIMEAFEVEYGKIGNYTSIPTAEYITKVRTEHQAGRQAAEVLHVPLPVLQNLKEAGSLA